MAGEREEIRKNPRERRSFLALGMAIGVGIGTAIGAATDQMGTWLPIGVGVGIVFGAALTRRMNREAE